ncbi:MAG: grasp-with-spasm system SPASM domain peptide maturase [Bacteroidetes bacterium]|nr:grasp-with-spasm system SPASM domain peptide maturase [Bacteroidota bacterium]
MYLKLFSNCMLVAGHERSLLFDAQRHRFFFVPNIFNDIFKSNEAIEVNYLYNNYPKKKIVDQYIKFLLTNDLAFYCSADEVACFPSMELSWDSPYVISNMIIDFPTFCNVDWISKIIPDINELGICAMQIRFFEKGQSVESIISIIDLLNETRLNSIELILPFSDITNIKSIRRIYNSSAKIFRIHVHSSRKSRVLNLKSINRHVWYNCNHVLSEKSCGTIEPRQFAVNLSHFTESQHHNTCLNRKIAIDTEGNIKNCPSMAKSYGNIRDTKLTDVVNNPDFQKVWHIKKDEITKCRDCEFRHICTDCRAYIENPEDQYSAPLKCGYNPYIPANGKSGVQIH